MPKYTCEPCEGYEAPPFYPARVLDANGREVPDVIRCDTDTGRCEVHARDADGLLVVDYHAGEIVRHWVDRPAPLRLEEL